MPTKGYSQRRNSSCPFVSNCPGATRSFGEQEYAPVRKIMDRMHTALVSSAIQTDLDGLISGYGDPALVGCMCRSSSRLNNEDIAARNDARHNLQLLGLHTLVTQTLHSISSTALIYHPRWCEHCTWKSELLCTQIRTIIVVNESSCNVIGPQLYLENVTNISLSSFCFNEVIYLAKYAQVS